MTKPKPGSFYSYKGKDYRVLDPRNLSDTGEIMTKSAESGNWSEAVAYRAVGPGSPLFIRSVEDFSAKFTPESCKDVRARVQEREAEQSRALAAEQGDTAAGAKAS